LKLKNMTETSTLSFPVAIRSIEGITEYKLTNGLSVLLLADQTAQSVTVNVTYLVGSRHEGRGEAGMAHLLEHMLFKGTPTHPNVKAVLQDRGAFYNASTWYDRTVYFETLSATEENLECALKLEADRMVNSTLCQEDLDREMTVVRNEFEMNENDPIAVLHNQMFSAAYQWHNYGKTTIGNRSDIERVSIENLKIFYEHYYQPDNAVLIIAGNFHFTKTQTWIMRYFGILPKPTRVLNKTYTDEPAQDGPRAVKLLRAGDTSQAAIAYHIPAASHPDFSALMVLSEVLCNEPSGLLFQSLVQTGIASRVYTTTFALKEPGIFLASARPSQCDNAANILDKMLYQLENLNETVITSVHVERARTRILKQIKMHIMNSKELAFELSEAIAQGDYRLFFYTRDQIKTITVDDVIRVATSYFIESNRTTGLFIPTNEPKRAMIPPTPEVEFLLDGYCGSEDIHMGEEFAATTENIDAHTIRTVLGGSIKTWRLPKQTRGQVNQARLVFRFGNEKDLQYKQAILQIIPSLLRRGSVTMPLEKLQDTLDKFQSTLDIYPGELGAVVVDITSNRHHLQDVIIIASDLMQSPCFSQEEFAIVHQRVLADLMKAGTDPIQIGMKELDRLRNPFNINSIHYVSTFDELIAELNTVSLEQVRQVYTDLYGANHLEVTIVGDCDHSINSTIESCFGNWRSQVIYNLITKPVVHALSELRTIITPDKQMAVVAMGINFAMRDDDIHYPAMRMANHIFGENMKSRLVQRLREKEGLSYGTGSSLDVSRHDSSAGVVLYAMCATDKADFTLNLLKEEYHRWVDKGVTEQELQECKQSFQLYFSNVLANDAIVLQTLASMINVNRTFGYYAQLLDKMDQLQTIDIQKVLEIFLSNEPIAVVKVGDFKKTGYKLG
jgi:zinc protease